MTAEEQREIYKAVYKIVNAATVTIRECGEAFGLLVYWLKSWRIENLTNSKPDGLERMFFLISQSIGLPNYKELWEAHKAFHGSREIKDLFPEGHVAHGRDAKTVREQMDTLEILSAQGTLRGMLEHRRKERLWEFK